MRTRTAQVAAVVLLAAGAAAAFLLRDGGLSEYTSVTQMVAQINDSGIPCTGRKILSRSDREETGLCYVDDGTYEVDMYVFDTADTRDEWLEGLRDVYDQEIVVGANWYLTTGHRPLSEDLADALDGEVTG